MKGFVKNIERIAVESEEFRRVLYTAKNCQLVVMALAKEEIGAEVHELDQFFPDTPATGVTPARTVLTANWTATASRTSMTATATATATAFATVTTAHRRTRTGIEHGRRLPGAGALPSS